MSADVSVVLFEETFADGGGLSDRWQLMEAGDFRADDGVVDTSGAGMSVAPAARHPRTAEPSFTKSETGFNGHLKWLAVTADAFPIDDRPVRVDFHSAAARTFGMAEHPFGDEVKDPLTDFRLGAATLNVMDFESGVIFDFWITQNAIYPFYERLRLPGLHPDHEAFGSISKPIPRAPETGHDLAIVVDTAAGTAHWEADGRVVAAVSPIGPANADWTTVLSHGGTPAKATPRRLQVGLGLLTLLDATLARPDHGLVDLGTGYVPERTFHGGPDLWGQGVELQLERVVVTRG
jgi:hypothetical protein